jgi:hypothetical protein
MKDGFNHDFYITAATVIPLLYITLFLQGQSIEEMAHKVNLALTANVAIMTRYLEDKDKHRRRSSRTRFVKAFLVTYVWGPLVYVVMAATLAGVVAEAISLWALFYSSDNRVMRGIVLWSMFGLIALMSANPTTRIFQRLFSTASLNRSDGQPEGLSESTRHRPPVDPPPNR